MENLSSSAIVKHKTNSLYIFFYRGNCKNIFRCQRLDSKVYNGEDYEVLWYNVYVNMKKEISQNQIVIYENSSGQQRGLMSILQKASP